MRKRDSGYIYGTLAAISYGTNPLFALPLYAGGIGVNSVLFYRYAFAVVIYALWLKFVKKTSLQIKKEALLPLFILGILFSLSSLLLFEAFKIIDAGIACTILFIYPVMVAIIMALFFGEKFNKTTIISLLLTSSGIALLSDWSGDLHVNPKGILVVLLSSLCYATYMVGVQKIKAVKHLKSSILSFYVMLFGLFVYIFNLKLCTELQILHTPFLWLCAIALALIPTIFSIETINYAIRLIGSTKTALLGSFEPLTALFIGITVFHEHLSLQIVSGAALILFGVALLVIKSTNKSNVQ